MSTHLSLDAIKKLADSAGLRIMTRADGGYRIHDPRGTGESATVKAATLAEAKSIIDGWQHRATAAAEIAASEGRAVALACRPPDAAPPAGHADGDHGADAICSSDAEARAEIAEAGTPAPFVPIREQARLARKKTSASAGAKPRGPRLPAPRAGKAEKARAGEHAQA